MSAPVALYTVGHSNRTQADFIELLRGHSIEQLADVRRYPGSRRNPHFRRPELEAALAAAGIRYRHCEELGGYRSGKGDSPHRAWDEAAFRNYADHMGTNEFRNALQELERWSRIGVTAVMCAEATPLRCHRRLLSDALTHRGVEVLHILGADEVTPHEWTPFARVEGARIIYDGGMLPLG